MKLHEEFDLNVGEMKTIVRDYMVIPPHLIEELLTNLKQKGYIVLKSTIDFMGVPKRITLIKKFKGPFVTMFSAKMKQDFIDETKNLRIEGLFV
ncbi:MAG TPA: hypothetical protein VJJ52_01445 [Candidatus Nanoarchaeia archaeon]|nr:hypothetical protein [Candidatus Nanoarchaeia archaeon]